MEYAYEYGRYSSDMQTEASIDAQFRAVREYAAAHNIQIVGSYTDEAISGKGAATAKRAGYQKMLRDIKNGRVSLVLVHKYDRIARSLAEHVNLEMKLNECGVRLVAVAQEIGCGSEGKIIKTLLWAMSEYYIDNLAGEIRKGMKELALKGQFTGGVPLFGYDIVDKRFVVNELEAFYVRRFFDAVEQLQSVQPIIEEMKAAGISGKRGKEIKYTQVYEMLRNEKYTGLYAYSVEEEKSREARRTKPNAIRLDGAVPAIITKEQFARVQDILKERKRVGRRNDYLCSGLVYCECGAKMHANSTTRKGHRYDRYICSKSCGAKSIRMEVVDEAANRYLSEVLSNETKKDLSSAMRIFQSSQEGQECNFKAVLSSKIREKEKERENIIANIASGVLSPIVLEMFNSKLEELAAEIQILKNTEPPKDYTGEQIEHWFNMIKNSPPESVIRALISRIEIKNATVTKITSTLATVAGINGCGDSISIFPTILFYKIIQ